MTITCKSGWNGQNGANENHDSSLSETEMVQLAGSMINVGELQALPAGTLQCWTDLAAGLTTGDIKITKGIHQRDTKVHFCVTSSVGNARTYHVFVVEGAGKTVNYQKKKKVESVTYFHYEISGFSCAVGMSAQLYPVQYLVLTELEKPIGRDRRTSFSTGNSAADERYFGTVIN